MVRGWAGVGVRVGVAVCVGEGSGVGNDSLWVGEDVIEGVTDGVGKVNVTEGLRVAVIASSVGDRSSDDSGGAV